MRPWLRPQIEFARIAPDRFLARNRETGEYVELGLDERFLLSCCDGRSTLAEIAARYRLRFAREVSARYLDEFIEQLLHQGLVVDADATREAFGVEGGVVTLAPTGAVERAVAVAPPAPFSADDPVGRLNHRFDVLTLLFGWLVHPMMAVPVLIMGLGAACVLVQRFQRLERASFLLHERFSLPEIIVIWLGTAIVFLGLPTAILKGIACRRAGGIVTSFHLRFHRGLLPLFECHVGESFYAMSEPARWTMLSLGIWVRLAIGSLALMAWTVVLPRSQLSSFCLILAGPAFAGMLLRLNVLVPLDGYAMLSYALGVPRLEERAKAETRRWLTGRKPVEALAPRQRYWFRVYGLLHDAWIAFIHLLLIGVGGSLLVEAFGGGGVVVVAVLVVWWYHKEVGRFLMSFSALRWLLRGGGRWYIRWPLRLALLAGVIALGFIPYNHEIGGDVRIVPRAEAGVRAHTSGEVTEMALFVGDHVTPDEVVVRLAGRRQRAEYDRTKSQLDEAQAHLDLLEAGTRPEEIEIARNRMEMAQRRLDYTGEELKRIEVLAATQTISDAELQNAIFDRDQALEVYKTAQEELSKLTSGSRAEEIRASEARVEGLKAILAHCEHELRLTEVRSPIAGDVITPHLESHLGHYVEPGELIAIVQDSTSLRAEIAATEDAAVHIKPGQKVKIRLWGTEGELLTGRVTRIAPVAQSPGELNADRVRTDRENLGRTSLHHDAHRYIRIYAEVDRPQYTLVPDMTGYARIVIGPSCLWEALARPVVRFVRVEVWSWLP